MTTTTVLPDVYGTVMDVQQAVRRIVDKGTVEMVRVDSMRQVRLVLRTVQGVLLTVLRYTPTDTQVQGRVTTRTVQADVTLMETDVLHHVTRELPLDTVEMVTVRVKRIPT